jgi:hypothetical protein
MASGGQQGDGTAPALGRGLNHPFRPFFEHMWIRASGRHIGTSRFDLGRNPAVDAVRHSISQRRHAVGANLLEVEPHQQRGVVNDIDLPARSIIPLAR